jgi:hypothetical protein
MDAIETFLMYLVITVLMTPLLAFYGLPFIVAARLFHRATPLWLTERARLVAACGIASLGIAPAYDAYMAPKSIYLWLLAGDEVGLGAAALSFALTWLIVYLQVRMLARGHARHYT